MPQSSATTTSPAETTTDTPDVGTATTSDTAPAETGESRDDVVAEDLLVEEVSIDGMCGVY